VNPTYDFAGQVALVTGGSSGMGFATARAFAEAGAAVVIADINETTLGTAADELKSAGHRVLGVRCDVSDEDSVAAMVKATVDTFDRLDMAFNNAGIQVPGSARVQVTQGGPMTEKRVWFFTGAGRGMGVDFAKAALAAGNAVVATGRNTDAVRTAVGEAEDLLVVQLDVTSPEEAEAAVKAAVDRFGRIDVLVNNAANFYGGYFEQLTPAEIRGPTGDGAHRTDERHPRRLAGDAQAALRPHHVDLVRRWHFRL
jgi:NAD(P)-dependent dehydrogenase (short-subunit alcohol dehydrogenase family)